MKYSNFHITVNFNVDREEHIAQMRTAVEEMVEAPFLWQWLKQYNGHAQVDFNDDTYHLVDRVRLRAAFEHGGQQNRGLHVHILVEVAHTTMVQVRKDGIEGIFRHFVPGMNPNVHSRFVRGQGEDKDFILHYISKEVRRCDTPIHFLTPPQIGPRRRPQNPLNARLQRAFSGRHEELEEENLAP